MGKQNSQFKRQWILGLTEADQAFNWNSTKFAQLERSLLGPTRISKTFCLNWQECCSFWLGLLKQITCQTARGGRLVADGKTHLWHWDQNQKRALSQCPWRHNWIYGVGQQFHRHAFNAHLGVELHAEEFQKFLEIFPTNSRRFTRETILCPPANFEMLNNFHPSLCAILSRNKVRWIVQNTGGGQI